MKLKDFLSEELILEYIQKIEGHKDSKRKDAPWVIKSHKTNEIIASHQTKEEAKKHLKMMKTYGD